MPIITRLSRLTPQVLSDVYEHLKQNSQHEWQYDCERKIFTFDSPSIYTSGLDVGYDTQHGEFIVDSTIDPNDANGRIYKHTIDRIRTDFLPQLRVHTEANEKKFGMTR